MRFLSADLVFPIHLPPVKNGIVVLDDSGIISDFLDPERNEISDSIIIEKHSGLLCPGFVNAHCHLELSHLKGKFTPGNGLPFFIGEMVKSRNEKEEEFILKSISEADDEMYNGGIVAVGDISNTRHSLSIKGTSKIFYHTFIELFDIFPERAAEVFLNGKSLLNEFNDEELSVSMVPHAPYTVSNRLFNLISDYANKTKGILCIHNQETQSENEMFEKGTGNLKEKLQQITSAYSDWLPSGKSSLATFLPYFPETVNLQLVHNTFTNQIDMLFANQSRRNLFWCLCVNANQFIENRLPDVSEMKKEKCVITIGTDSYAGNTSLSILNELKTISSHNPHLGMGELLSWATINGATFLGMDRRFGSFEKGKQPGVNLITGFDEGKNCLTDISSVKRLM